MLKRIWHKTYFITFGLFMLAFFACIFIINLSSLSTTIQAASSAADGEAFALCSVIDNAFSGVDASQRPRVAGLLTRFYNKRGVQLAICDEAGAVLSNGLPEGVPPALRAGKATLRFVRVTSGRYAVVEERLSGGCVLTMAKSVERELSAFARQALLLTLLSTGFTLLMGLGLYYTLLRINRPVDNLAHELRTPLTTIRGYAEYLLSAKVTEQERYESLQYIVDESARLSAIAEKLLTMANLRSGSIEKEKVAVSALFDTAARTFPGKLTCESTEGFILGDRTLLQSLVTNLAANGVKAGGSVHLSWAGNVMRITDDGCGMGIEQLELANRGEGQSAHAGSGLGIPLCHEICALHGAQLLFTSAEGEGTEAKITFTSPT